MLAAALIVFREVFKAGLILGIVLGATRGVPGRGRWVLGGIGAEIGGACVVAAFAGVLADAMQGVGQEVFNAGMKSYGRAPTFLLATGHEQVRSIVAALAGDWDAACEVRLELPATGVCSGPGLAREVAEACCTPATPQGVCCEPKPDLAAAAPCCGPAPARVASCCG